VQRAEPLSDFPEPGTLYRRRRNVRRLRCKTYFIFYRLMAEQRVVEILD
jgi:plasmid stabilization system protein ParE